MGSTWCLNTPRRGMGTRRDGTQRRARAAAAAAAEGNGRARRRVDRTDTRAVDHPRTRTVRARVKFARNSDRRLDLAPRRGRGRRSERRRRPRRRVAAASERRIHRPRVGGVSVEFCIIHNFSSISTRPSSRSSVGFHPSESRTSALGEPHIAKLPYPTTTRESARSRWGS